LVSQKKRKESSESLLNHDFIVKIAFMNKVGAIALGG
jgi:hypothetical protein